MQRGKWILENVFGAEPPPPPNVPELEECAGDSKVLSMRARMAQHRANPVCASCDARMDSPGLRSRTSTRSERGATPASRASRSTPRERSPNDAPFNGPRELRQALLSHPDTFLTTLTAKLVTYAIGRGGRVL